MRFGVYRKFLAALSLAICGAASAAPIVYTVRGTASGSVGSTTFASSQFRIDIASDTTQVTLGNGGLSYSTPKSLATIHIDTVGDATFTHPLNVFDSFQIKTLGISDSFDLLDLMSPAFSTYHLDSTIGPVADAAPAPFSNMFQEPLNAGPLTFTSVGGLTFTAVVPEPSAIVLLLVGSTFLLRRQCLRWISVWMVLACVSLPAWATPSITNLGFVANSFNTIPLGISDDGNAITGEEDNPAGNSAFLWTRSGGIQNIGNPSGGNNGWAFGISGDGKTLAGVEFTDTDHAYRWTSNGGFQDIGSPIGTTGAGANGISRDGSTIVGQADTSGLVAFRWTTTDGPQSIGTLPGGARGSYATGANYDGSVIVGQSDSPAGFRGFRWTSGGMQELPVLAGGIESNASVVNADGSVTAGYTAYSFTPSYSAHATRWTNTVPQDLGILPGASFSVAEGVNADGSVLVGTSGTFDHHAILWTQSLGMVDLNAYLPTIGLDFTGWTLIDANLITPDGTTLAGTGTYNGQVGSSRVDLQACKLEYSIVSPK